jgi:transcriptional regulator with XRE-family HTH domain
MDFRMARAVRIMAGESGLDIARLAGIDRSRHSLFENGSVELSDKQIESLRRTLIAAIHDRIAKLRKGIELLTEDPSQKKAIDGVGARIDGEEIGNERRPDS